MLCVVVLLGWCSVSFLYSVCVCEGVFVVVVFVCVVCVWSSLVDFVVLVGFL